MRRKWVLAHWKLFPLQKINREDDIFLHKTIVFSCPWNDWQTALSFRDAQTIFNVKFNVECACILRTTPVPKSLNTTISPRKQKEPETLGKIKSKRLIFLLFRKSLCCLGFENIVFVSLFYCASPSSASFPWRLFFFSLFLIYIFLDWVGKKQNYSVSRFFLTCFFLLVTLTQGKMSLLVIMQNCCSNCLC